MSKRAEYEILLTGKESVTTVASKIVSAVTQGQKTASAAIQKVNSDLQAQGAAATAVASKSKAALDTVASGAAGAASGIKAAADGATQSVGKLAGQKAGLAELNQEYARLKQLRAEAAQAGDGERVYNLDGQIRQVGFQINQAKRLQTETAAQQKANESLSSSYSRTYSQVKNDLETGAKSVDYFNERMEMQKQTIADMTARYQQMKASKADSGTSSQFLQELNEEKGTLAGIRDAVNAYSQDHSSLRTQLSKVRNEMGKLRMEGKENTQEYEDLRREMERLGTAYRELRTEQDALSSGSSQIRGIINGVQGLMGTYSAASGVVSLFVSDNEKLMQVQTKMQSVMAVMMGMQQMANAVHSTSAFRMVTCRKVTELWTAAQNRLTVAYGLSTVAAKAFMAAATMGIGVIIGGVISAISNLIDKHHEQKKAQEEAKKAEEDAQKAIRQQVANSIASQLVSYRKLQAEWKTLNGSTQKQRKFIQDNAKAFKDLGVRVTSVKDAENVLVNNESAFIESLKRRAMAAAAMELASKKYQSAIEKMLEAEEARKVTDDDRKKASSYAEEVYQGKVGAAKGVLGRGQVSGQRNQIRQEAFNSKIYTYGEARAKEFNDAAEKEIKEGDRYFALVDKNNRKADQGLASRGISPASGGDAGSKAGSIDAIEKRIQALTTRMKSAGATERAELQKDINAWQKKLDAVNLELEALSVPADPQTIQELETAITYYGKLLKVAGSDERAEIQQTINSYTKKKTAIEDGLKALSVPVNPKTLQEYSDVLSALERKLQSAPVTEQAGIQATINAYKREEDEMRARIALASTPAVLDSLADYEQAISACEAVLQYANEEERANIQRTINEYRRKKDAIEESLDALDVPSDPKSLEDIGKVISALEAKLLKAGESERAEIQKQINLWNAKKEAIEQSLQLVGMDENFAEMVAGGLGLGEEMELTLRAKVVGVEIAKQRIEELRKMYAVASDEERDAIKKSIRVWQQYVTQYGNTATAGEQVTAVLGGLSSMANSMTGVVNDNAAGWITWGSNVLSSIAQVIPQLISLCTANTAVAATGAASSVASIPFVGWILAGAAALSLVATLASIPKYAEGGIAYGPTIGLFGEYSGASTNPEVVAPLDRLKALIGNTGGGGTVEFRIEGRTLVGILKKENKRSSRIGRWHSE